MSVVSAMNVTNVMDVMFAMYLYNVLNVRNVCNVCMDVMDAMDAKCNVCTVCTVCNVCKACMCVCNYIYIHVYLVFKYFCWSFISRFNSYHHMSTLEVYGIIWRYLKSGQLKPSKKTENKLAQVTKVTGPLGTPCAIDIFVVKVWLEHSNDVWKVTWWHQTKVFPICAWTNIQVHLEIPGANVVANVATSMPWLWFVAVKTAEPGTMLQRLPPANCCPSKKNRRIRIIRWNIYETSISCETWL